MSEILGLAESELGFHPQAEGFTEKDREHLGTLIEIGLVKRRPSGYVRLTPQGQKFMDEKFSTATEA